MSDVYETPINFRPIAGTRVFRSSEPEDTNANELFKATGIKAIIDLRDMSEVKKAQGCIDYRKCFVNAPNTAAADDMPVLKPVSDLKPESIPPDGLYTGVHAIVKLVDYKDLVFKTSSTIVVILIFITYIIDKILGTKFNHKLVMRYVFNKEGDKSLLWLYKYIINTRGDKINAALRLLSDPEHMPAVVICSMGKDRTGVICMLIGHICGHSEEQLCEEYVASEEVYCRNPDHFLVKGVDKWGLDQCYKHAHNETIQDLLDHIKCRYETIDNYLDSIGFGADCRENLRNNIITRL